MKKTLLIAAAALAASIISSEAQVYSQNIVGYVNQALPANNAYTIIENPLGNGNNTVATVFTNAPSGITLLTMVGGQYNSYTYNAAAAPGARWYGATEDDFVDNTLVLAPGQGVWAQFPGATSTNVTFVGNVVSGTNNIPVVAGYGLYGSVSPIGTNATGLKLTSSLSAGTVVLKWNPGFASYTLQANGTWYSANDDDFIEPTFNVGEGFFIQSATSQTWTNLFNP